MYVSPLKALVHDVDRNLRAPMAGIRLAAQRLGGQATDITVGMRTGDTPTEERRAFGKHPPDILVTTPESLYLLLTSAAREALRGVRWVIVDEIHALANTKRGAHLALSLERLAALTDVPPQRIGLSATQRPLSAVAAFLGGREASADGDAPAPARPVTIVDAGIRKPLELQVVVPVEDMSRLGEAIPLDEAPGGAAAGPEARTSIWPQVYPRVLELIRAHRSTIVFTNSRRLAERLALKLNDLAGEDIVKAHHGSLAREQRLLIEEALKDGRLPALVATSSLELGIDMGAVDLVIQVESPRSVARGMQRIGRAGHQVDAPSRGRIFPKYRGDLLECAAVVSRMRTGAIEETRVPRLPLDVLAQQIVAMSAVESLSVDGIEALVRGAYPFAELSREQLEGVLDMLAGRYPSDEFAELRPRIVWDRSAGTVRGREGARSLAVQNAGTIPDRGLYAVVLPDGARVGELDEEMVYEARSGQTFMLGASTWRIEEITRDRVIVTPAPGAPGALPFWKGEGVGRPFELGEAVGRLARELVAAGPEPAGERLREESAFEERAADNLVAYLEDQAAATGVVPSDRAIVIERFRDEIGDWRLCVLTPFGARVHAPWALALAARLRSSAGQEAHAIWGDDGIAVHLPDADEAPSADVALIAPDELEELILGELGGTALFGARFRENAARALLIPRRRPGQRTPLWQQRLKASSLLQVARRYGSFPVILETYREVLNDWFDLPALRGLMGRIASREVAVVEVETPAASPFAGSLLFEYVASYMYEDDTPAAERRAQALSLNRDLLRELLGQEELRDLIDPGALAAVEADLQGLSERARARGPDGLHDLLRRIGDLTVDEVSLRLAEPGRAAEITLALVADRRGVWIHLAGERRLIAAEDAGRYRDALGVMPPSGVPDAFLEPVPDALRSLVGRYARSHGPFHSADLAGRYALEPRAVEPALAALEADGAVVRGELRPGGAGREWCDAEVVRRLRRASLAALRREIEPADPRALGRFLPDWQRVDRPGAARGADALRDVLAGLQGLALPPAQWEAEVLPRRLADYAPARLDELAARGEIVWAGAGAGGVGGGRVAIYFREDAPLLGPPPADAPPEGPVADALREALAAGASFWDDLVAAAGGAAREEVFGALWGLVWAGEVTNDLWLPLRAPRRLPPVRRPSAAGRRRLGGAARGAPSAVAGRWSLSGGLFRGAPPEAERRRALAELMVERHGILTRAGALSEGVPGGFAAVYPALVDLETLGACRRGYFLEGLGGAQFAMPGGVERLRDLRDAPPDEGPHVTVLGAADPAQPYGAAVPWPRREGATRSPSRVFGAQVVLVDGAPALYLERGGRSLLTFPPGDRPDATERAAAALAAWVTADRRRRIVIERVDGEPVFGSPLERPLADAGFQADLRGMMLRG
ncbi:MAG TPA: helicase-related protein [Miltoncostaeaceae bacterium]|nr:helicase-related protein [Miltoncostaeaceae bacterium]